MYFSLVYINALWMINITKFCLAKADYLHFGLTIFSVFPSPITHFISIIEGLSKEKGIKFKDVKLCYFSLFVYSLWF